MQLKYITCSDPRDFNDIYKIIDLTQISPRVEIAVQMHPSKVSPGTPRYEWFGKLVDYVDLMHGFERYNVNLAVHVNEQYCEEICRTGKIPAELKPFFEKYYDSEKKHPVVKRWQLNMSKTAVRDINYDAVQKLFADNPKNEFILQYNDRTEQVAWTLYEMGTKFSLLYDASGGRGIAPGSWNRPVYDVVPMGYSGGLSPENVVENLKKISSVVPKHREDIWIDAEGKLKTDGKFDVELAANYILAAEKWLQNQKIR